MSGDYQEQLRITQALEDVMRLQKQLNQQNVELSGSISSSMY